MKIKRENNLMKKYLQITIKITEKEREREIAEEGEEM